MVCGGTPPPSPPPGLRRPQTESPFVLAFHSFFIKLPFSHQNPVLSDDCDKFPWAHSTIRNAVVVHTLFFLSYQRPDNL
jgi:hypothetical protein